MTLILSLLRQPLLFRIALFICIVATCILAFGEPAETLRGHNDKLNHFLAFAVMAFLLDRSWRLPLLLQLLALLGFGIMIELVQSELPYRSADGLDLLADLVGALSYYLIARIGSRLTKQYGYA